MSNDESKVFPNINVKQMYVVFDLIAKEVASPVFLCNNDDAAKRTFAGFISGNPQYPQRDSYRLVHIGAIDLYSGNIDHAVTDPTPIMNGSEIEEKN